MDKRVIDIPEKCSIECFFYIKGRNKYLDDCSLYNMRSYLNICKYEEDEGKPDFCHAKRVTISIEGE